jgi:hypothetical protein
VSGFDSQFLSWYTATLNNMLYSVEARVYVGPDASTEWGQIQQIVDSIRLSGHS